MDTASGLIRLLLGAGVFIWIRWVSSCWHEMSLHTMVVSNISHGHYMATVNIMDPRPI